MAKKAVKSAVTTRATVKPQLPRRKRVTFRFQAKEGADVRVAGSFNNWDPKARLLNPAKGNGEYASAILLPAGRHEYKFIVDGQWLGDPVCAEKVPDGHGAMNSVVVVE
ncbi:MAG: glycogen-binding domain-containing protein [bacterium]